jgi:hypothetical protein
MLEGYPLGLPLGVPCRTGIIALVALASLISLHLYCHQRCKLASAQLQLSHNTSAYVMLLPFSLLSPVASLPCPDAALASLPALHWRPCPHCAGANASIALLLMPALCRHHCR